jgi:dTDP-4-amino-4,6-dideoxygalactose transaminase
MMTMISYGCQDINQAYIDAVFNVLQSDFLTQGPVDPVCEKEVTTYCGEEYGVVVTSATSAQHIACLALDVECDSDHTTPTALVSSVNCALYCGATVDFVDSDLRTNNHSLERFSEKFAEVKKNGNLLKVLIPMHLCCQSADMAAIHVLSQQYGFKFIKADSHAIGARYKDYLVSNWRYCSIRVLSLRPIKNHYNGGGLHGSYK